MMDAGVRAAWAVSSRAVPFMVPRQRGLIVNISVWAAQKFIGNTIYGVAKAATDKLTADMAHELRPHGVAVVSLYPGLVRTESVLEAAKYGVFDLSNSESPEFLGRVVAALAAPANHEGLRTRSGTVVVAAQAAMELGVADVDGKQPSPLTLQTA
jgi:NAD(P)-dependent dehydrogenase (short-subunit alcohol dehydrogenase family)